MSERISVGSSYGNGWFIASIVLAILSFIGGGVLVAFHPEPGIAILALGALFVLIALVQGWSISRNRKWLTVTEDGFTYEDRRGVFDFSDDDIVELGTWARTKLNNGVPKSIVRTCRLILEAGEYRGDLNFQYSFPIERPDPHAEFLERNLQRLTDIAKDQIARSETLAGANWELEQREFHIRDNRQSETHSPDDFVAIDVVDNHVCIWLRGEAKPKVRIPAETLNALVLLRILGQRLQDRGVSNDDAPGLGRIIFERDHSISSGVLVFCFILGALMVGGSFVAAYYASQERNPTGPAILAGVLLLLGIGIPLLVWLNRINVLRCHTKGVCRMTTKRTRELEYKDMVVFSYGAIRQYVNGSYSGTTVTMNFEPSPDADAEPIKYSATMKNIDAELENLRDHVSTVIASEMKRRLDTGESIRWTEGMLFTPEGLQIDVAGGILNKAKSRKLPYVNCLFSLQEGYFYLFKRGGKDPLYTLPVSATNFFPGFMLLNQLSYEANQKTNPATDDGSTAPASTD